MDFELKTSASEIKASECEPKFRILILAKYWHPFRGGIEDNARSVTKVLAEHYHTEVVAFDHFSRAGMEVIDGFILNRVRTPIVFESQPLSLDYLCAAVRLKADIIYVHAPNALASVAVLLRRFVFRDKTPIIVMHHMDMFGRPLLRYFARVAYKLLLREASKIIVTSRKNGANSKDINVKKNLTVIPLGIDLDRYSVSPDFVARAAEWRRQKCGDAPVIVFVGRLARYKGIDVLVRALTRITDAHLLIGGDGPLREPNEVLARELGIAGRVHFLGQLSHDEKLQCLSCGDVFAFPSTEITEAFGISQIEAMAIGCPVVASNLPTGVTDVALDEDTALVVPPRDEAALAAALNRILADKALAKRLVKNARHHVEQNFTSDRMGALNLALVAEVLAANTEVYTHSD